MAEIVKLMGEEISVTAAIGNSTTVNRATLVRVYNDSGSVNVISVTDPLGIGSYSGIGSMTVASGAVEFIEKPPAYTIWGKGTFRAAKVGFTN
tara:strand:+ start:241 stop:519 length:279 start_codon:yes stop_codon:yes gene_type:complete